MKLKDLYKSWNEMSSSEKTEFITTLREKRKLPLEIKKPSKKKALLSSEEESALNKVLSMIKLTK